MKKTLPWLWLIFLCAFFLRVYNLDAVSLRGDEAFTVNFVQRTWDALWKGIRFIEPNPPGLYLALRAWVALAGASELVARFFSVWFGVLNSALIYRLAREMIPNPKIKNLAALIAALLIAFSPYQIWHSQDVRNYTLWPAVSMLALIFFWRVWRLEVGSWKLEVGNALYASRFTFYALYFLSAYLALMTFYYETFIVVAQNVFFAISFVRAGGLRDLKRAGRALARWSAAQIVLIAAYGAWILQTDRVTAYGELSAEQSVGLLDMLTRTVASFVLGDTVPDAYQHALAPIVTIALIACLIVWARQDHARAIFIALYVAVPLVGVYLTSLGRPLFSERYITGILPAYFLLIAFGLTTLWKLQNRWRAIAVALAAIFLIASAAYALANYYFNPAYAKAPDWRGVWQVIAQERRAGDIVVQNFTDDAMSYYRNRFLLATVPQIQPGCNNAIDYLPVITLPKDFFATAEDQKRLAQLNADCQRIWFIPAAPDWWDPARAVEKYLTRHDDLILDRTISTLQLQLYQTPREFETQLTRIDARVDNAQLVGYRAEGFARGEKISIAAGKILRVVLYWRAANQIEKDYAIFAHLVDANDQIAAQLDHAPVPGDYPTSVWRSDEWIVDAFDLRVDAPPGTYTLVTGMYDPATVERVPARDPNDARFANDRVTLFQITISP